MNRKLLGGMCPVPWSTDPSSASKCDGQISGVGKVEVSEPVDVATGNMFYAATDYATAGPNPLRFTRYYNSRDTSYSTLGVNWHSNFNSTVVYDGGGAVFVQRASGPLYVFYYTNGVWTPDADVDFTLTGSGSNWTITDHDDNVEVYSGGSNQVPLVSITARNGYTQTLAYNGSGQLTTVTDSYGRVLTLSYNGSGLLQSVKTPDNTTITYGYTLGGGAQNLTSVTYPTATPSTLTYAYDSTYQTYEAISLPNALTGVIDENGNPFLSWTYDLFGRALTSTIGNGTNAAVTTIAYDDTNGTRTVKSPLGVIDTYSFTTLQNDPKVSSISRAETKTTAAATRAFAYDSNGYMAGATDWNGNLTTYTNDSHGDPLTVNDAVGSPVTRETTVIYDSKWVHLPSSIVTSGLSAALTYDSTGELLTKTFSDTTTTTTPYSASGQKRTWTNTWSNYLLASTTTPNGNQTQFGYDSSGALTSVTDPLNHETQITAHTGGGLPETIIDPNSVTTTLTYDARQRRTSSAVSGKTGTYKTTWTYDAAGNLTQTTLPDNSFFTNSYDTEHRLIEVTDALGNYVSYALDALGDPTQTSIYNSGGTATWQSSGTFDALGRELVETAGAGQTTTRTYDPNGNILTVTDGLSHTTTNTYDALNRLDTSTDANSGVTTEAYDTYNRIISVTDANGNVTSYVRNGFGDVIQQSSPDSGVSVFHYDADANLTAKTDALGVVTNQTFDAVDRPLTTTYPSNKSENVSYTYDQTGTGFSFGIGRLTSVTDAAGSLIRAYEERGNLVTEQRVNGKTTLTSRYTYDGASRVATMTYPDGTLVDYSRDAAGYVSKVTATLPGVTSATTIGTFTHEPFGPMDAATFGNGISEKRSFDESYRPTKIADTLSGASLQNLTYAYDDANNVSSITDAVNAANSQTFGYDVINRLISAASGAAGYGSYSWTYDKVGNRLTQVQGSTTTTYGYTIGSNRLATITSGVTSGSLNALLTRPLPGGSAYIPAQAFSGQGPDIAQTLNRADSDAVAGTPADSDMPAADRKMAAPFANARTRALALLQTSYVSTRPVALGTPSLVVADAATETPASLQFIPITPCRIVDTRNASGPFGGPELVAGTSREFDIPQSSCNIPATAAAYSLNVTVVPNASLGYLTIWPSGETQPVVSTLNSDGRVKANATITPAGTNGGVSVFATDASQFILDIDGYFVPAGTSASGLEFFPLNPCRIADTRNATGPLGGPSLASETSRAFPVQSSSCGIPSTAQAYSLNITAVPQESLGFLTAWPSGQTQPVVSTLNSSTGVVTANAAIVPAGTSGEVSIFVSDAADVILDVNGYFAPPATGGLSLYTVTPCRALDTRSSSGAFKGTLAVDIEASACAPPATAQAYVLNATVVPPGPLSYLTLWPAGGSQPDVSTLNADDGAVTSNMAIVPTSNGSIDAFSTDSTQLILDLSSYFALPSASAPEFSFPSGTYASAQTVSITDATPGATIYYTVNGSVPTTSSTAYTQSFAVSGSETLKAIAIASGYGNSAVATAAYLITNTVVATPTISPAAGTYKAGQAITISDPTYDATIYFTTDGTTPTTSSTQYTGPFTLYSAATINAIAATSVLPPSAVATAAYEIGTSGTTAVITNANGNITSIPPDNATGPAFFSYNAANRLASVIGTSPAASYVYDYAGKRITKTNPTSTPILYSYAQDGSIIAENNSGMLTDYIYVDGRPIAVLEPGATPSANQVNYILADHLGTPQVAVNSTSEAVWETTYQPFGSTGNVSASIIQNLRFPGQYADTETDFSYNLNRDYMPNLGRYLESDPIGLSGGFNTYAYADGNPLSYIDPYGTEDSSISGLILGGGLKKVEETTLSNEFYQNTNLSQKDAESIAKVCIGLQDYFVDNGLDWTPLGLSWSLLSDQAKDAIKDQVTDTVLHNPDIQSGTNSIINSSQSLGTTIRTWIQDHTPAGIINQTLSH